MGFENLSKVDEVMTNVWWLAFGPPYLVPGR